MFNPNKIYLYSLAFNKLSEEVATDAETIEDNYENTDKLKSIFNKIKAICDYSFALCNKERVSKEKLLEILKQKQITLKELIK